MHRIERIVEMITDDESNIGVLSCGERIAAALLFDRKDWLPDDYKHPLEAYDRLGSDWIRMITQYRRDHKL